MDVRVETAGGVAIACRWRTDADAVLGARRRTSLVCGAEGGRGAVPLEMEFDWISPAAEETLFVNEEIAQPVQEAASLGWGVLMRGE